MSAFVEIRKVTKQYGDFRALDGCSFEVRRGEVFGLLGPNGSGKTTLLRTLLGYLKPTAGSIQVDGLDCTRQTVAVHRRLAYLPAEARLPRRMRGHEAIRYFSELRPDGDCSRALAIAERLGLDLNRQVARCSTGMRQMLALSFTVAMRTPLLILDEPTANLDPSVRGAVLRLVEEARDAGRTVIFSSHVLPEVEQVCDRVGFLRCGRLVHLQTMTELRRQHRIRARLTGPWTEPPEELARELMIRHAVDGDWVDIDTDSDLAPLLGWLGTLPLAEMHVAPRGLQSIYDRHHMEDAAPAAALDPTELLTR